jgi:hypothetical protein
MISERMTHPVSIGSESRNSQSHPLVTPQTKIDGLECRAWLRTEQCNSVDVLRQVRNYVWNDARFAVETQVLDALEQSIFHRTSPRVIFVFLLGPERRPTAF